jgi:exosortase A-associated hydrolase 1
MNFDEHARSFACGDGRMVGIVSAPATPAARGVLIVVGGPQYRAGSHRQFTLLARSLAARGIPVMRFDYRGMGDSEGAARDFEAVGDDLRAATDEFMAALPALREIVIWGLCDAASAALFYAHRDPRVRGLVLLNPWVRTSGGIAKTTLKHYYRARLLSIDPWQKILRGRFAYRAAALSLFRLVRAALSSGKQPAGAAPAPAQLPERMHDGLRRFDGAVLLIISGADLTAKEFLDMAQASAGWQQQLAAPRVARQTLAGADHTFSRQACRDQVADWTADWMGSW